MANLERDYRWFVEILKREFGNLFLGAWTFDYGRGYGGAVKIGETRHPVYAEVDEGWNGHPGLSLNSESDPAAVLMERIQALKG